MSKKVDERVVSMEFDNRNFESNVKTSMSTLDKLKKALKLDGVEKGFNNIDSAAKKLNFSSLNSSIETVNAKFSTMQVVAMTALSNITSAAMNAGTRLLSALTIDPIISGFREYETQINAVQTILANTQSKGSTLQDVNRALDELNKYADQTIYNFTEMTKNIGTFTAAGVDLEKSVTSIKGIANLAAVSGSTSVQASTAMYQLSQALAAGRVSLMDWNSVVNAGMGGELFQNALKRTAENMGTNVDALIEKYGSFRESLTKGEWLTADVLTETLTQLSGAYTEADLIAQGYTKSQAKEITELAETAVNAATKVKTFTQLFDTLGEALQSGWTNSWEIILGDFNEAQDMFTDISNTLGDAINASADARNEVLMGGLASGWKQFLDQGINDEQGFLQSIKKVAKEHGVAVDEMTKDGTTFEQTLKKGWLTSDILTESVDKYVDGLSKMSVEQLKSAGYTSEQVKELQKFAKELKSNSSLADEFTKKMKMASGRENIIEGLWNAFQSLGDILGTIKDAFTDIFPPMTADQLYDLTVKFRDFTETLKPSTETLDRIKRIASGVFSGFQLIGKGISVLLSPIAQLFGSSGMGSLVDFLLDGAAAIGDFITQLNKSAGTGEFFSTISEALGDGVSGLSSLISSATAGMRSFGDIFTFVGDTIVNTASNIWDAVTTVFGWIKENIGLGDIFNGIMAGTGILGAFQFGDIVKQFKEFTGGGLIGMIFGTGGDDDGEGKLGILDQITEKVTGVLDNLGDSIRSFTTGIKATTLLEIAAAMLILANALEKLAAIDPEGMLQGLIAMGAMFTMLNFSFKGLTKTLAKFDSGGLIKAGITLVAMAYALNKFADALVKVSDLDLGEAVQGLFTLGVALAELIAGLKFLDGVKINLRTIAAMLALSYAAGMLGDAFKKFAGLSWDEIGRGLGGMGGALGELVTALGILSKVGGGGALLGAVGIVIAVQALEPMVNALQKFGQMSWDEIKQGLAAMGGALLEFTIALGALSKLGGFGSILGGVAILIAAQALEPIANTLQRLGQMSWEEIGRGLAAMGGALGELALFSGALGKIAGFSGLLGAGSILIVAQALEPIANALQRLGQMSWEEIGRGLTAMGGALLELGSASFLTGLGGLASLVGAGTINLAVQPLEQLANALQKFGEMSWDEIGRGLTAMGAALGETGLAAALTGLAGISGIIGAGTINLTVQSLEQLANALQKFGEMSWDEIGRGLTAMGAALGETALGGILNTFSGFGAGAISQMAEPLGQLADSVKKWTSIEVPEGFGEKLGQIGEGVSKFNFAGWGAEAIANMGGSLGQLADSVKKWADVTVPDGLGEQLKTLAPGIEAFNFSGWGSESIATLATPLGQLADSVKKWGSVTVPEGMQTNLEGLANGVKAFNFSGWGAGDMADAVEPIGNLAGAVSKWSGITVPENIEETLTGLARGVKAFDLGIFEGVDMDKFIDPLSELAGVLPKYNGLTISTTIGDGIESLGEGVKSLKGEVPDNIDALVTAFNKLVEVASSINNSGLSSAGTAVKSLASAINSVNVSSDKFANLGKNIVSSLLSSLNAGIPTVRAAATNLANSAVNAFVTAASSASTRGRVVGQRLIQGLSTGMRSGIASLRSTMSSILSQLTTYISSRSSTFTKSGTTIANKIATGIRSGQARIRSSITTALASAAASVRSYYSRFYSSGSYIASGLANGMRSQLGTIRAVASQMASAAATAAAAAAQIRSPSRVFMRLGDYMGQGLVIGMENEQKAVYRTGMSIGNSAIDGLNQTVSRLSDALTFGMDANPTIRPILDLSDVESGANSINSMLNGSVPLDVLSRAASISRSMNSRIQNGSFDDVVKAVDRVRGKLGDLERPSYTVNGVTYDDGSNVASAVDSLTRAIRIERRV